MNHDILGVGAVEIVDDELVLGRLTIGNGLVDLPRIIIPNGIFPCHLDVSAENLSKLVESFESSLIMFLVVDLELHLCDGEEELDAIASRIRHDFGLVFFPIRLGLLKTDLALVIDLVVPRFLHSPVGV